MLGEGRGEDKVERNVVGRGNSMYEGVRCVISWCVQATRNLECVKSSEERGVGIKLETQTEAGLSWVKKVYFGGYVGLYEAGGWESSEEARGLEAWNLAMEKIFEKYLGGKLDNSGNDWMFWSGMEMILSVGDKAPKAWVIGQVVMFRGNRKVKLGFRNRSSVWCQTCNVWGIHRNECSGRQKDLGKFFRWRNRQHIDNS